MSIKKKLYNYQLRVLKKLWPVRVPEQFKINIPYDRVGSDYGFVAVPQGLLNRNSVVYSVGAGLDIHSDIGMARQYDCLVYLFDPTPGAIRHFNVLKEKTTLGQPFADAMGIPYEATADLLNKLVYYPWALWTKDEMVQFFEPEQEHFISHSITDSHATGTSIDVQARALESIMRELQHQQLDYLKLDIEGAEFLVIDAILKSNTRPRVLYLEYHYDQQVSPAQSIKKITDSLSALYTAGYRVYFESEKRYFGLVLV
jgi:FkbM family methyltransferase